MSAKMIAEGLSTPQTQLFKIITKKLSIGKVYGKLVSQGVREGQNSNQKTIWKDLVHRENEDPTFWTML